MQNLRSNKNTTLQIKNNFKILHKNAIKATKSNKNKIKNAEQEITLSTPLKHSKLD